MTMTHSYGMAVKKRKREINPEAKKDEVLRVAETLFSTHGFSRTTTNDIAAEAGVAVGTVFRIFKDKQSILCCLHERMESRFIAAMNTAWYESDRPFPERFRPMFSALLQCAQMHLEVMRLYAMTKELGFSADYQPGVAMISAIKQNYSEGVKEGELADIDVEQVAFYTHGMVDGAMRYWMVEPTAARMEQTIDLLVDFSTKLFVDD